MENNMSQGRKKKDKQILWKAWLKKWRMSSLKISLPYLNMEWKSQDSDRDATWGFLFEVFSRSY